MNVLQSFLLLTVMLVAIGSGVINAHKHSNPFIWRGTHWCGVGESSSHNSSLRNATRADICCKEHDTCPHYISRWSKRYNLFNWRLYTISSCTCDDRFHECLRQDGSLMSRDIKRIYFDMLQVPCFDIEMKETRLCVARYWYLKCKKFKTWMEPFAKIRPS